MDLKMSKVFLVHYVYVGRSFMFIFPVLIWPTQGVKFMQHKNQLDWIWKGNKKAAPTRSVSFGENVSCF